jgi:hypothetical protein
MPFRTYYFKSAKLRNALTQLNVRTAACHVRGYSDSAPLPRQGDNFRFFFMVFGVKHLMWNALFS